MPVHTSNHLLSVPPVEDLHVCQVSNKNKNTSNNEVNYCTVGAIAKTLPDFFSKPLISSDIRR